MAFSARILTTALLREFASCVRDLAFRDEPDRVYLRHLVAVGCEDRAIRVYDDVVERVGDRNEVEMAAKVATALVNKGAILASSDRLRQARESLQRVVARYSSRPEPALVASVALAERCLDELNRAEKDG